MKDKTFSVKFRVTGAEDMLETIAGIPMSKYEPTKKTVERWKKDPEDCFGDYCNTAGQVKCSQCAFCKVKQVDKDGKVLKTLDCMDTFPDEVILSSIRFYKDK